MPTDIQTWSGNFLTSFQFLLGIWMYGSWLDSNDTANTVLCLRAHEALKFPFWSNAPHELYVFAALYPFPRSAVSHFVAFCVGLRWQFASFCLISSAFLYHFFCALHEILFYTSGLKWSLLPLKNASCCISCIKWTLTVEQCCWYQWLMIYRLLHDTYISSIWIIVDLLNCHCH